MQKIVHGVAIWGFGDGQFCFAASNRQLAYETGLSTAQIRTAIGTEDTGGLVGKNLVLVRTARFQGHPTQHFRFRKEQAYKLATIAIPGWGGMLLD